MDFFLILSSEYNVKLFFISFSVFAQPTSNQHPTSTRVQNRSCQKTPLGYCSLWNFQNMLGRFCATQYHLCGCFCAIQCLFSRNFWASRRLPQKCDCNRKRNSGIFLIVSAGNRTLLPIPKFYEKFWWLFFKWNQPVAFILAFVCCWCYCWDRFYHW